MSFIYLLGYFFQRGGSNPPPNYLYIFFPITFVDKVFIRNIMIILYINYTIKHKMH